MNTKTSFCARWTTFMACVLITHLAYSQNCKPDLDKIDKVTKQGNIAWEAQIYESGFGSAMVNTSDWYLSIQFGRYGSDNILLLFLNKYEESAQNQAFESQYQAQKGGSYYLAFSQGEALKLTMDETKTESKMNNMLGKLVTTVTIGTSLSESVIKQLKDRFENGTLTTVRLTMAGNVNFEKDIKQKKAELAKQKFECFLSWNANNPVSADKQSGGDASLSGFPPLDETTGKVSYSQVVTDDATTSSKKLYERAKRWLIEYYKDSHIKLELPDEGKLSQSGSFMQTFTMPNGKQSTDELSYTISIAVKDGKYKYIITDIVDNDGKSKQTAEAARDILKKMPVVIATPLVEQYNQGFNSVIASLKAAMKQDAVTKDTW